MTISKTFISSCSLLCTVRGCARRLRTPLKKQERRREKQEHVDNKHLIVRLKISYMHFPLHVLCDLHLLQTSSFSVVCFLLHGLNQISIFFYQSITTSHDAFLQPPLLVSSSVTSRWRLLGCTTSGLSHSAASLALWILLGRRERESWRCHGNKLS